MEEDVSFIAKRYRKGKFSVDKGWKHLNLSTPRRWNNIRIAATVASVIILSASAALIYRQFNITPPTDDIIPEKNVAMDPKETVKVIDFENTPLPVVITKIKDTYGVEVVNIPENADDYMLSLHYEGNPVDLISTINDILETKMAVKE